MTDTPETPTPIPTSPRRAPRWMKVLLGLSLAANLLVVGLVAGAAWRFSKQHPGDGGPRNSFAFVAALERADRRAVLSELRSEGRSTRQAARQDTVKLLEVLRAPDLDTAALSTVMMAQSQRGLTLQQKVQTALQTRLSAMTHQERLAYADRLEEALRKGRRSGKHKKQ